MTDEKPTVDQRVEEREMRRVEIDVMLANAGFGPVFEIDSTTPFMAMFGGSRKFTSCRGCGAVVRLGEIIEVDGRPHVERGVWEHSNFHTRIGDPLKAVNEG